MERKRQLNLPGQGLVDVTEVGFRTTGEYFNEYLADDGSVIQVKAVVSAIYRVDGQVDELGNPVYIVKSQNITNVSGPEAKEND